MARCETLRQTLSDKQREGAEEDQTATMVTIDAAGMLAVAWIRPDRRLVMFGDFSPAIAAITRTI